MNKWETAPSDKIITTDDQRLSGILKGTEAEYKPEHFDRVGHLESLKPEQSKPHSASRLAEMRNPRGRS